MFCKLGNFGMDKAGIVIIPHLDRLPMGASVEHDFFILGQGFIDKSISEKPWRPSSCTGSANAITAATVSSKSSRR